MKLKSYFSGTVEAAMALARKELGEDALLVNARPATPETRAFGAFEVVFGIPPKENVVREIRTAQNTRSIFPPQIERLSSDIADLKRELQLFCDSMHSSQLNSSGLDQDLLEGELGPILSEKIAQGAPLETLFKVDAALGREDQSSDASKIIALVGPPGAGKTTTLVKLAARYGLSSRRRCQILSTDVFRIAAADQLRSLAAILGIAFEIVDTPLILLQALEEYRSKEFIFIDTPGFSSAEMGDSAELAHTIATHPEIDIHLVASASMKSADLARVIDQYAIFAPKRLIFTRLDETETAGGLIRESARCSLPISFLCSGQQIPDDIEPASKERLITLIGAQEPKRLGATA